MKENTSDDQKNRKTRWGETHHETKRRLFFYIVVPRPLPRDISISIATISRRGVLEKPKVDQFILSSSRDLSHFLDMVKSGLFFIFFVNVN